MSGDAMKVLLVTLDTNQLDDSRIESVRQALRCHHELACVTVTMRERGQGPFVTLETIPEVFVWDESRWGEAVWGAPIPEVMVLGESPLGTAVLGSADSASAFEEALRIISNGSFPASAHDARRDLSDGQRRQLRDAMIFEAHVRTRRHVLVTEDRKGFIDGGRRERLQRLGRTRILTPIELQAVADDGRLAELLTPPE